MIRILHPTVPSLAALLLVGLVTACASSPARPRPGTPPREVEESEVPTGGPARGPEDAPVTIVEFSDFRCPYCRQMLPVLDRVVAAYPDQVRVVYAHFPVVSPESGRAAVAAQAAAEQGRFWEMHAFLFQLQRQRLDEEVLREKARQLGMDPDRYSADLRATATVERVERDLEAGKGLGIRGTPAYLVNGRLLNGTQTFDTFRQLIEAELALTGPLPL